MAPIQEREEAVAIVDPYTSGRFLVDELCQRGWPLVAVRSSLKLSEDLIGTWNPAPFEHVVVHHGDLAETVEALRSGRKLRAVIAGCEIGVALTDSLAKELGLRGNSSDMDPRCRWDQYMMHERLKECGLRSCPPASAARLKRQWPLLGSDESVFSCLDPGSPKSARAAQEFPSGTEYVVDCVSLDGRHFVSATWAKSQCAVGQLAGDEAVKDKLDGESGAKYVNACTVPYSNVEGSVQQQLYSYVFECLTALGIENGASHSEVMYSPATGPCLIETGARMHGSVGPALWARCAGHEQGQAFLLADVFTEDGAKLREKLERVENGFPAYELGQTATHIDLQCNVEGVLAKSLDMTVGAWIRSLPTFWMLKFFVEEGDCVETTQDGATSPGFVILVGPDQASVERDCQAIRSKERSGEMYVVESEEEERMGPRMSLLKPPTSIVMGRKPSDMCKMASGDVKHRELDAQIERLLSPLVSRASSPVLSPQQAPALPPGVDEMVEFTLGGAEGLLDLDDFDLDAGAPNEGMEPPSIQIS